MDFGKLPHVDHVRWDLPPDDPLSLSFLAGRGGDFEIRFGAPAWAHKEWVGPIYPPKTKATEYLHYYSRYFTTIELNTTHYRIPGEGQVTKWAAQTPASFRFCPKVYQGISHSPGGLLDKTLLAEWCVFLERLGERRGPSFLQLSPSFSYDHKAELFEFLQRWPAPLELSIEFRHPSWFQNGTILPALTKFLQARRVGLVITDVAGRRDVLHSSISADFVLLRFVANNLHPSDEPRMRDWVRRFRSWRDAGLRRVYLFIHGPDDEQVPGVADLFIKVLRDEGGWDLAPARPAESQLTLG